MEYYFSGDSPAGLAPPEWPLDRRFARLHGVLYYVVKEEHSRVGYRREVPMGESLVQTDPAALPRTDPVYPRSVNNLGVLADLRGNRRVDSMGR